MLTCSFDGSALSQSYTKRNTKRLESFATYLHEVAHSKKYLALESSLVLPSDTHMLRDIYALHKNMITRSLKYVIVIGIGGSNLGTKAIYDAMYGYTDPYTLERFPKLICLDTCDPVDMTAVLGFLKQHITQEDQYLINVISKSGATTETAANMAYMQDVCAKTLPGFHKRIVITTDRGSALWGLGEESRYPVLEIPKKVGGRYSVFSSVGLFPLLCLGVDIKRLLKGAQWALKQGLIPSVQKNTAIQSSLALTECYNKGGRIHDTFLFVPALETVGKWYRQLFAESLGKIPEDKSLRDVIQFTPTVSIGTNDLHSMAQLYLANPQSRFTSFVSVKYSIATQRLHTTQWTDLVEGLEGISLTQLQHVIYRGVVMTYKKKKLPYAELVLKDLSPYSLGAFMQMKMLEVMYCAHVFGVNAFDQPHVELYKKEIRALL